MVAAYLNNIATAVPPYDVHQKFVDYVPTLLQDSRKQKIFNRMIDRAQIDHRYSFLEPSNQNYEIDRQGFYSKNKFPSTQARMKFYEAHAFKLVQKALEQLNLTNITHLIITSCTGFYAPGLDIQIIKHFDLPSTTERTIIGFMGCNAAFNALKQARHIVRSNKEARVLTVNLELCTLHLKEQGTLEEMLSYLIFADGCAASIISSEPTGFKLDGFHTGIIPDSDSHITWHIGDFGFDMCLSGRVPASIADNLPKLLPEILSNGDVKEIQHWAIHPGGRSILDAVRDSAKIVENHLTASRDILRRYGNMSSATIMFVLEQMLRSAKKDEKGCAMGFGPGITVESMRFTAA